MFRFGIEGMLMQVWSIEKLKQWAINMDEEEKRLETIKNVLLIKTAVYVFIIVFVITIIVRLAG